MHTYLCDIHVETGIHVKNLCHPPPYILRQGFSLNLELTNLAMLSGRYMYLPTTRILQALAPSQSASHIAYLNTSPHARAASTPPAEPPHSPAQRVLYIIPR